MSVTGKIKNGVVVLPPGTLLPEGADVKIETVEPAPKGSPLLQAILKLSKPRPHWPKDYALNHAHYVKGHPKKT